MKIMLFWGEILSEQFKRPTAKYTNHESCNFWKIQDSEHNTTNNLVQMLEKEEKNVYIGRSFSEAKNEN